MNTDDQPLVSICCVGYNHARFIKDNIKALWDSGYENLEIIVVDDGSTDKSGEILKEFQKQSPYSMKVILQKNTGNVGHNFNKALHKAKGKFIYFTSLDDFLYPKKLKECINRLVKSPNLAFVASSKVSAVDCEGKKSNLVSDLKLDSIENPRVDDLLELEYSDFNSFYIQGAFFRKDIIDKIGGFDEDMTGDDIVLRTKVFRYLKEHSEYGYEIIKEPICYYRQHNENISGNSVRQIKIVTEYLQRYWADRENPDVLVTWALHAIKNLKFEESIGLFSMNTRAALLLANNKIQKALMKKARRETSILRHIYYKTKEKNKRTITIFSFFKISYTKKDS